MANIRNFLSGIVLGVANVIPGVSAGTMAVVMGIYDRLISCVNLRILKKNISFLLALALGVVAGILLFSNLILFLLDSYPVATNFVFIGLIFGSIPMIYRSAKFDGIKLHNIIPFFIALAVMISITLVDSQATTAQPAAFGSGEIMRTLSVANWWWLFTAAMISAFMMILPGISGSFIMLVLGVYTTVMTAITEMNVAVLIPVAIGVMLGIVFGAKIIEQLLHSHPQATYMAILGLVVGSIFPLFPDFSFNTEGIVAIVLFIIAMLGSYRLGNLN